MWTIKSGLALFTSRDSEKGIVSLTRSHHSLRGSPGLQIKLSSCMITRNISSGNFCFRFDRSESHITSRPSFNSHSGLNYLDNGSGIILLMKYITISLLAVYASLYGSPSHNGRLTH